MRLTTLALCVLPFTAHGQSAEIPLSADKLDIITLGKSYVVYPDGGEVYGITVFHPNRTVTWLHYGEECTTGTWSEPEPGLICFDYPHAYPCWHFFAHGDSLRLQFNGDPDSTYFYGPPGPATSPCGDPIIG